MSRDLADALRWTQIGTDTFRGQLEQLGITDEALSAPSTLPGWTRKHLVAHVAANASALCNLAHWAHTGVETPMYASTEQRNADIEAGAKLSADELLNRYLDSAAALDDAWQELDEAQWDNEVRTAQGRTVPASETPWMRAREVLVHALDLGGDATFAALPADFVLELVEEVVAKRSTGGNPALTLHATDCDQRWQMAGPGDPVEVAGPLAQIAAYLTGRRFGELGTADGSPVPELPAWL